MVFAKVSIFQVSISTKLRFSSKVSILVQSIDFCPNYDFSPIISSQILAQKSADSYHPVIVKVSHLIKAAEFWTVSISNFTKSIEFCWTYRFLPNVSNLLKSNHFSSIWIFSAASNLFSKYRIFLASVESFQQVSNLFSKYRIFSAGIESFQQKSNLFSSIESFQQYRILSTASIFFSAVSSFVNSI